MAVGLEQLRGQGLELGLVWGLGREQEWVKTGEVEDVNAGEVVGANAGEVVGVTCHWQQSAIMASCCTAGAWASLTMQTTAEAGACLQCCQMVLL